MGALEGRRVLVVGASGGLGREMAGRIHAEGAVVAAAGRRVDLLEDLQSTSGPGMHAVACDVRDPASCSACVERAAAALGGLDGLVYAPGLAVITRLARASAEHWNAALSTNLVGAGLVTAAAVPHLEQAEGVVVYLSSVSAHLTPPWKGMGLYAVAKVALEKSAEVWKLEHPRVRFTSLVIGSTSGGDFFPNADKPFPEEIPGFQEEWRARGYLAQEHLEAGDQAEAVVSILASRAQIDVMWSRPATTLQLWEDPAGG